MMEDNRRTNKAPLSRPRNGRPTIGLLASSIVFEYLPLQMLGVTDVARERDVNLICFIGAPLRSPHGFEAQGNVLYELVAPEIVDGLLIWTGALDWFVDRKEMQDFCRRYHPLPVVSVEATQEGIPSLLLDSYQGMREAIVHLIEVHGYRRIAFIRGPEGHWGLQERYRAYTETLAEYGLPFDPNLVTPYSETWDGAAMVSLLLDERKLLPQVDFEAVVCVSDGLAVQALNALQSRGIHVPEDIALVGYDDVEESRLVTPPLTTVRPLFYEMGRKAVEMLLALLEGEEVPEGVVLPSELVVRQSCGCLDPMVIQAATGPVVMANETFEVAVVAQREKILSEMIQAVGDSIVGLDPAWVERLLDAFIATLKVELDGETSGIFLITLDNVLRQVVAVSDNVMAWQNVISALHRQTLPFLHDNNSLSRAEDLWEQARVMIGDTAQRIRAYRRLQAERQAQTLREIGQALITTFDMRELMDVLAQELPRLGIPSAYLSLYEDPKVPTGSSRLILAYDEKGRVELEPCGQVFPTRQLVPDGVLPQERLYSMVTRPLYFREDQIGFVLFEMGSLEGFIYDVLRGEISSALQGALLVQRVQEHSAELATAYEEIRILNNQLKEENIRMSAELDVVRRLQEMILPSPEELQQIEGLEIVGFMQPADEVGGDYYDIFKEDGGVHIGIGDVTGHGLESGVLMLMTQTAIRTLIDHGETDPVTFLNTLNRVLYDNIQRMKADKSLTLVLVNYQDGQLKVIGQHEELLVVRRDGQVERIDTMNLGFLIGLEKDIAQWISEATVSLEPGDGIVLYTDGITEAENLAREQYGIERLCDVISRYWNRTAEEVKQAAIDDVIRHIGKQKIYDDLTLVVLKQQ